MQIKKTIIGIDPGLTGAIAVLYPQELDSWLQIYDAPVVDVGDGKKVKRKYNIPEIVRIFREIHFHSEVHMFDVEIWIEDVHAMPGQGVTSMFSMGRGLGMYEGVIAAMQIPYSFVSPITWKKSLMAGMGKEKEASVIRALQMYPKADLITRRGAKLHGRADALLIATYGKNKLEGRS